MGKRWCAALLCAVLACSMTGCGDFLDREWYEVQPPLQPVLGLDVHHLHALSGAGGLGSQQRRVEDQAARFVGIHSQFTVLIQATDAGQGRLVGIGAGELPAVGGSLIRLHLDPGHLAVFIEEHLPVSAYGFAVFPRNVGIYGIKYHADSIVHIGKTTRLVSSVAKAMAGHPCVGFAGHLQKVTGMYGENSNLLHGQRHPDMVDETAFTQAGRNTPCLSIDLLAVYAAALSAAYSTRCFHCSINAVICAGGSALSKPRACVT